MNYTKIKHILDLNRYFYQTNADDFSNSRRNAWKGWARLIKYFDNQPKDILDLGCGNGRFYKYLKNSLDYKFNYIGIDNCEKFILEAKKSYQEPTFINKDIFFDIDTFDKKFDFVGVFGVMHHIPDANFRIKWIQKITEKINNNGILALSFWQLDKDKRFLKAQKTDEFSEDNDYYYGWSDTSTKRYVHIYTQDEINKLTKNLKLLESYENDGKPGNLNKYIILQKI